MLHLLDFFDRYVRGRGDALLYDDGFRRWSYTGDELRAMAEAFAARLMDAGLQPGERLVIWGDDRPEWVAAFWGCMLRGVAVVPLDARASPELLRRVLAAAVPRGLVAGENVEAPAGSPSLFVWRLREIGWIEPAPASSRVDVDVVRSSTLRADVGPDTIAEIIFTSGTTGDPKGVVITHRNIIANITPIERTAFKYRAVHLAVAAAPLPRAAPAQSHVRPGPDDLPAAARPRHGRLHQGIQPGRNRAADPPAPDYARGHRAAGPGFGPRSSAASCPRVCGSPARPGDAGTTPVAFAPGAPALWMEICGIRRRRRVPRQGPGRILATIGICGGPRLRSHRNRADCGVEQPVLRQARHRWAAFGRCRCADRPRRRGPRARPVSDGRVSQCSRGHGIRI